jgi:hypothetical protein
MEIRLMELMARGVNVKEASVVLDICEKKLTTIRQAAVFSDPSVESFRHLFCEAVRAGIIDLPEYPPLDFLPAAHIRRLTRMAQGKAEYGTKIMTLCNATTGSYFEWKLLDQVLAAAISQGLI